MSKTTVLSSRLEPGQERRLSRMARRLGRTPSETGALLIEEGLRRSEFAFIDFRDSPVGRQAHMQGSSLAVWEVIWIAKGYEMDVKKTAAHLEISPLKVQSAFKYAEAFSAEIESALREHEAGDFETLSRMVPQAEVFSPQSTRKKH